ncbi:hypothetical protein EIN_162050 [Entamoeba invadens IP1]|uniref:phospholipase A2 n=1 Tax=Entamoeba invadens IP1 TaxID=370355 RepID=A0A0A1TYH6_ENTIV|nr:hypothetical protein EIN_162050 [Entamoeba invadens IP1]ELP86571.1 hypothetical protein EIN_162050 [Entamoeba invadens IP1]|eukprot:XP_004185917.1 hypothetical protein EIN_162050 [Entamoeba invadens IP1]
MITLTNVIDAQNLLGETALHLACLHANKYVADLLLDNAADVTLLTTKGLSAYDYLKFSNELCVDRKRLDPKIRKPKFIALGSKKSKSSRDIGKSSMSNATNSFLIEALDDLEKNYSKKSIDRRNRRNSISSCSSAVDEESGVKSSVDPPRSSSTELKKIATKKENSIFSMIFEFIEKKMESGSDSDEKETKEKSKTDVKKKKEKKLPNPIFYETAEEKMRRYEIVTDNLMKSLPKSQPLRSRKYNPGDSYHVLSLDGGGVKCIYQTILLRKIVTEIPEFFEKIDLIAGLSASSLICASILLGYDLNFIEKLMEVVSFETFKSESHLAGIAGHQFSNKFMKMLAERMFGDRKLSDLTRDCSIQSFLIDSGKYSNLNLRNSKAMLFNNFESKYKLDGYLRDVCLQSAAAPGYFDPLNNHVDGSVLVNNPFFLSYPLIIGEYGMAIPKAQLVVLSIGSGYPNVPYYDIEEMGDAGLVQWLIKLSDFTIFARKEMAVTESKVILGERYHRLDPKLTTDVEICDSKNIPIVKQMAEEQDLSETLAWIKKYW